MIPEEVSITPGLGGMQLNAQRHADSALMSWRAGKIGSGSLTSGLSLSTRASDLDLKDFLAQRGVVVNCFSFLCMINGLICDEFQVTIHWKDYTRQLLRVIEQG